MDKLGNITGSIVNQLTNSSDGQAKPSDSSGNALRSKSASESLRRVLDDRMTYSEAMGAVAGIVSCYPNSGRDVGGGYLGAIANVLTGYPRQVVVACADPKRGIARTAKFLPNVAELVAWCENETRPLRDQVHREQLIEQLAREREEEAKTQAPQTHREKHVAAMKEKYGDWNNGWKKPSEIAREAEESRARLRDQIGAAAFDALPDQPKPAPPDVRFRDFPPPQRRDSDRDLKASPELVKALQEKHAFEQAQGKDESPHWSEGS